MNTITVSKANLLETLKKNREEHRGLFLEAQKGFRKAVIATLDQRLQDARDGKKIDLRIALPEPQDYTGEFDTAIKMLEWDTGDEVELTMHDFQRYVENQWEWRDAFTRTSGAYLTR